MVLALDSTIDGQDWIFFGIEMLDHEILSSLAPFLSYNVMPERRKKQLDVARIKPGAKVLSILSLFRI